MKKQLIGTCVNHPFGTLNDLADIIDKAREITKATFLKHCFIMAYVLEIDMKKYPDDYKFYKTGDIYFFTHSAIEYFYQ